MIQPIDFQPRHSSRTRRSSAIVLLAAVIFWLAGPWTGSLYAADEKPGISRELRQQALAVLRQVLKEEHGWYKVRAAEFLVALDYPQDVEEIFSNELKVARASSLCDSLCDSQDGCPTRTAADQPGYRVGVWGVLARVTNNNEQRKEWLDKISDVFIDAGAPDRTRAAEALAELGYKVTDEHRKAFEDVAKLSRDPISAYAAWVLVNSAEEGAEARLAGLLDAEEPKTRDAAAHALGQLAGISAPTRRKLALAAISPLVPEGRALAADLEPGEPVIGIDLVSAAAVHAPPDYRAAWKKLVLRYAEKGSKAEQRRVCQALARLGGDKDLPLLRRLLKDPDADVRSTAAWAILRIGRRVPYKLGWPDWAVIAFYACGMIAVGWYYSRRTATTEDYLLGGRKMRPLSVGLSLFATLLSTISYLAWPGEMIKYGPAMFCTIAAYPLIFFVVGWFLIPFIMTLKVTSAYEILESRLGLSVRMLGSVFFLSMRLLWMAVIIYATTSKVLVPLLGLPQSATPWLCAVLGLITVIYTSMGGLRAVVLTDVVQTLILFGAVVVTIVLITVDIGGVGAWWPRGWPSHWPAVTIGYDCEARVTVFGAMLAAFTWYVCTSGSDQMAIQRYLATRDVKAARRVLATSLSADATVALFLGMLGLALLAYFRANPHFVPDGQTLMGDADKLFPRFIVFGLPVGVSGLVVAGLLAAAMSSLSSGVNSSCSVVTVDFIDRFRKRRNQQAETDHVRLAKFVSVGVGIVVVVLSSFIGMVEGNLLEIAYKVVNLLTAPLFGLFFMAIFVRFATVPGTLVGAVFGVATVFAINYWKEMTGTQGISFLWAMPAGLMVQVTVGSLVSLIPIGRVRPLPD